MPAQHKNQILETAKMSNANATQSKFGMVVRVTSGNFLEMFDFFLFGFYATYIAKTYFPADSEFASLMLTFGTFGAGFIMRPVGAIVLGAYIDKVGRRQGLITTLAIMAMGALGSLTRVAGFLYGSDMAFAVGKEASAPGQIPIADARKLTQMLIRYS